MKKCGRCTWRNATSHRHDTPPHYRCETCHLIIRRKPVNRTELVGQLSVTAETCDALDEHMWADLMRDAAHMLKQDGANLHHLNEQLLNVRAELQMLQHVINTRD